MKQYTAHVCVPCKNNQWQAHIEERKVTAENLNDLIEKAYTAEEHQRGARIVEVWEHSTERGVLMTRII